MNFYNWNFLKSCFFIGLTVAVLGGIAITILPEQREMISIVIKSALVTGLLPIGLVIGVWLMALTLLVGQGTLQEMAGWVKERSWGHIFTVPGIFGLILMMCMNGPDIVRAHQETDPDLVMIWGLVSFGLLGIGWFINHFPTSTCIVRNWSQGDSQ